MCGIVCLFDAKQSTEILRPQVLEMSKKIRHRGPDWSGVFQSEKVVFSHERLAIVDPASGKQPLFSKDGKIVLAVNGEIYNHRELKKEFPDYEFQTSLIAKSLLPFTKNTEKILLKNLTVFLPLHYTTLKIRLTSLQEIIWEFARFIKVGIEKEIITLLQN